MYVFRVLEDIGPSALEEILTRQVNLGWEIESFICFKDHSGVHVVLRQQIDQNLPFIKSPEEDTEDEETGTKNPTKGKTSDRKVHPRKNTGTTKSTGSRTRKPKPNR